MVERSKDCLCFICEHPGKIVCAFKPLFAISSAFDVTVLVTKCKEFKARPEEDVDADLAATLGPEASAVVETGTKGS